MKAALGIMTTDTQPKVAMENAIGNTSVKIYGIKGSGMICLNMATTLYVFTDEVK